VSGREAVVARFQRFASGGEIDLFEGALLIAQLIDPHEDLMGARERVDALTARVLEARAGADAPLEALRRVLFAEEGLRGDVESYDDPGNSSVARVLATRRGMPITLSIVALEVGRRAGMELQGIGLPGHFVIGGQELPPGLYLDPFDGGNLYDTEAVVGRVGAIFGSAVTLPPEAFLPDSPGSILARVLFNLRRSFERRDRFEEALAALECAEVLAPGEVAYQRERGLLLLRCGRTSEALPALDAYVAAGMGEDVEAVGKLVALLRQQEPEGELPAQAQAEKKIFTLDAAREALPRVREITSEAASRYARLSEGGDTEEERQTIVRDWVREISSLGAEIKGLWLVDFDSGAGYYCWKYPEQSLEYFHGYEEGFAGRLPLQ
jgi:regulator of sirC expression with transglutaminase-like and TPR domain